MMIRIPYGKHFIDDDDINAVATVMKSNNLTQGRAVEIFEESVANYVGSKYAVAVSSGTAALHLATMAANLKRDDSVLTSPITFVATANSARYVGAQVLFSDISEDTANICPDKLEKKISLNSNVRLIMPVHFAGGACDMKKIKKIADKKNALIIEDAAHAFGSHYDCGDRVGSCKYSDMTTFSFHPVKQITTGEGGVITTNDKLIYKKLLRLRSHGINKLNDSFVYEKDAYTENILNPWYYEMVDLGFNYRMTDMQAALGTSQLKKIDSFIKRRRDLVLSYDEAFKNLPHLRFIQTELRGISAHHLYVVKIDFKRIKKTKNYVMETLKNLGIGTQIHYIPVYRHPYYRGGHLNFNSLPNAEKYYEECLSLPLYFSLTDSEQEYVIKSIKDILN